MLDRLIRRERRNAEANILRHYQDCYLREAVLAPSGRFGLYAVAKELLSPGDRVIVSPITCRTVIGALLAARVTPVFVDIEPNTGNIDHSKLSSTLLKSVRAIVTTNLYGNPDCISDIRKISDAYGLLLIEDCAHILRTTVGNSEVGGVGDLAVFSFKKFFDEPGGVVLLQSETAARRVRTRIETESAHPLATEDRLRYLQFLVHRSTSPWVTRTLSTMYRKATGNSGIQVPSGPSESDDTDPKKRSTLPTTATLLRVAEVLQNREQLIKQRLEQIRELIAACPLPLKQSAFADQVCYLAVPFSSTNRDRIVEEMKRRGVPTYFLYKSRVNDELRHRCAAIPSLDRDMIDEFCQNILPINPRFGREYLEVISRIH